MAFDDTDTGASSGGTRIEARCAWCGPVVFDASRLGLHVGGHPEALAEFRCPECDRVNVRAVAGDDVRALLARHPAPQHPVNPGGVEEDEGEEDDGHHQHDEERRLAGGGVPDGQAGGRVNRAIRALQLETELRTDPGRRAERFVERWQKLDQTSQRQYRAGDTSGYKSTRAEMGDMAKSLQRDPQLESLLANRKRELGIGGNFDSGRRLGDELAFTHGIDLGRGRSIGL